MLLGRQGRREGFKSSLGRREGFKASLVPTFFLKPEENLQKSARQVAKGHAAGPPRAPGRVEGQLRAPGRVLRAA